MILYILQKGYETKTAKGVDELNALALKGFNFIKAVSKDNPNDYICNKCGKEYKSEKPYLKHVEKCEG